MPRVHLTSIVCCLILCAGCGVNPPTEPSRQIAVVTGTWLGTYRVTGCSADFQVLDCSYFMEHYVGGSAGSMRLVLAQTGLAVSGTFDSDVTTVTGPRVLLPVSGSVDSSGTLRLEGGRPFVESHSCFTGSQSGIDITHWRATMDEVGTRLTGTFHQSRTGHFFSCYVNTVTFESEIVTLTRQPAPISSS